MGMVIMALQGVRVQGPLTNLAAVGVANAVVIYQMSNWLPAVGGQQVGTKSAIVKRVKMHNNAGGNTTVIIGTGVGAGFVPLLPALDSMNNLTDDYVEGDLPEVEAFLDITAYPTALVALGTIDIVIEVEEIG